MRARCTIALAAALAAVLAAACSSHEPPRAEIEQADVALRRAAESQAGRYAPAEMRRARAKLDGARDAYSEGEYEESKFLAEQAAVDAEVAAAKAGAAAAKEVALDAQREIDALRRDAARAGALRRMEP